MELFTDQGRNKQLNTFVIFAGINLLRLELSLQRKEVKGYWLEADEDKGRFPC